MSDFQAVITQAGLNAAVSADSSGIQITITHIGAGTSGYTPTRSRTALSSEAARVPVAGSTKAGPTQWHLTAEFTAGEFAAREVGFYLEDGTLFAVWSHPSNVLFHKTELARVVQAFDLVLEAVPADAVTVNQAGDLSLYYAPEFMEMTIAQTQLAAVMAQTLHRQMQISEQQRLGGQ